MHAVIREKEANSLAAYRAEVIQADWLYLSGEQGRIRTRTNRKNEVTVE